MYLKFVSAMSSSTLTTSPGLSQRSAVPRRHEFLRKNVIDPNSNAAVWSSASSATSNENVKRRQSLRKKQLQTFANDVSFELIVFNCLSAMIEAVFFFVLSAINTVKPYIVFLQLTFSLSTVVNA